MYVFLILWLVGTQASNFTSRTYNLKEDQSKPMNIQSNLLITHTSVN